MRIILASASPRRSDLLREMGVDFEVAASSVDELHDENLPPGKLCEINAQRKAADIAERNPTGLVIGADTLVAREGRVYGKPRDIEDARQMLRELAGKTHVVVTGVCLIQLSSSRQALFHDVTQVTFKAFSAETIHEYVTRVHVLDKAGAYGIQERGELIVESITGSFTNVVGLPVERLAQEFESWGVPYKRRSR